MEHVSSRVWITALQKYTMGFRMPHINRAQVILLKEIYGGMLMAI
jgi:hypothetical protein